MNGERESRPEIMFHSIKQDIVSALRERGGNTSRQVFCQGREFIPVIGAKADNSWQELVIDADGNWTILTYSNESSPKTEILNPSISNILAAFTDFAYRPASDSSDTIYASKREINKNKSKLLQELNGRMTHALGNLRYANFVEMMNSDIS